MSRARRTPEETGALLSFESLDSGGLRIVDHIERRQCTFETDGPVSPREVSTDEFYFPVDRGVAITTDALTLSDDTVTFLRNHAGFMIGQVSQGESRDLPEDLYSIELPASIKLYVVVEASLTIEVDTDTVRISFDHPTEVFIGARSHHEQPAATITTTDSPADVMEAVSFFGSALKTPTCERSYPTLRGHPPLLETGERLHVPSVLDRPQTGVRIEVPNELTAAFAAAPLAYYLGAEVVPNGSPVLITDTGFRYDLTGSEHGFEEEMARLLKQCLFLDCLTRTEGIYKVDLHERNELEGDLPLDFGTLYDQPLPEQLEAYLRVSYSVVEPHLPEWPLDAYVDPRPDHIRALPFLTDDLAVIRPYEGAEGLESESGVEMIEESQRRGALVRSTTTRGSDVSEEPLSVIDLGESDAMAKMWLGDGMPSDAIKGMVEAFRNRLDRPPTDGDIDITVVVNDSEMAGEGDAAESVYGSRSDLPFDVSIHRQVATTELRTLLSRDIDLLHYIGHIDADGFECPDGFFDAVTLETTNVDAFFLNACTSYRQGMRLIEAGAIAAVVTLHDVIDSGAERVGRMLARLLNQGFPFQPALEIAKQRSIMGGRYLLIGDGRLDIAQPEGSTPAVFEIERGDKKILLHYLTNTNSRLGIGSITVPYIKNNQEYYLTSGMTGHFVLEEEEFRTLLHDQIERDVPIYHDGDYVWATEFDFG